jgi:hypothetical protein
MPARRGAPPDQLAAAGRHASRLEAVADGFQDPLLIRELARLELRVHQVTVERDLKGAAPGGDELEIRDLLLVGFKELFRQTDGLGFVVSHGTIFQHHVHDILLSAALC